MLITFHATYFKTRMEFIATYSLVSDSSSALLQSAHTNAIIGWKYIFDKYIKNFSFGESSQIPTNNENEF